MYRATNTDDQELYLIDNKNSQVVVAQGGTQGFTSTLNIKSVINLSDKQIANDNLLASFGLYSYLFDLQQNPQQAQKFNFITRLKKNTSVYTNGAVCYQFGDYKQNEASIDFEQTSSNIISGTLDQWVKDNQEDGNKVVKVQWAGYQAAYVDDKNDDSAVVLIDGKLYSGSYQNADLIDIGKLLEETLANLQQELKASGLGSAAKAQIESEIKLVNAEINNYKAGECNAYNATAAQSIDSVLKATPTE